MRGIEVGQGRIVVGQFGWDPVGIVVEPSPKAVELGPTVQAQTEKTSAFAIFRT